MSHHAIRTILRLALLAAVCTAGAAAADDRSILRDSGGAPYVFVVLDTSGSMHFTTPCGEIDDGLDIDPWDGYCTRECIMDATVCEQFDPGSPGSPGAWTASDPDAVKCVEFSVTYDDDPMDYPPFNEVIVDEEDGAPEVVLTGSWTADTDVTHVGSQYIHNTSSGGSSVLFRPNLPFAGTWHVYLFYNDENPSGDNATNVPVTVTHANGYDTFFMDQTRIEQTDPFVDAHPSVDPETYNYVGTFEFNAGTSGTVLIETDNTIIDNTPPTADVPLRVNVDTVRFVAVERPAGLTCLRTGYRHRQPLCPRGDCPAPANGDDPSSKSFQAREALFEVLDEAEDASFGFATYEQDNNRLKGKHWLYRIPEKKPSDGSTQPFFDWMTNYKFPKPDGLFVYGLGIDTSYNFTDGWACASGAFYPGQAGDPEGNAAQVGCVNTEPADFDDPWEMERARRIPKLGIDGVTETTIWYRDPDVPTATFPDGQLYKAIWKPPSSGTFDYGTEPVIRVQLIQCGSLACGGSHLMSNQRDFEVELVTDFAAWELNLARAPAKASSFFPGERTFDASLGSQCLGLEPNDDRVAVFPMSSASDDSYFSYTHKWDTTADARGTEMEVGDFVPLDWLTNQRDLIMGRLAGNLVNTTTGEFDASLGKPDFRIASYWASTYGIFDNKTNATSRKLRLIDDQQSTLLPIGDTPIGASLEDFDTWYNGDGASLVGFSDISLAAGNDPEWGCRKKYVFFLTEGNETCGGDPATAAANLLVDPADPEVSTYVIGFGLDEGANQLGAIATAGGTVAPVLPRNKQDLVDELRRILNEIVPTQRSFASASIPAAQSSAADKIYLSTFVAVPARTTWPSRLDVFRNPLPLDFMNEPNRGVACSASVTSSCYLYDVAELLIDQAPDEFDVALENYHVGSSDVDERRVFYSQANLTDARPGELVLFDTPDSNFTAPQDTADLEDLAEVLAPDALDTFLMSSMTVADGEALEDEVQSVIGETLVIKSLDSDTEDELGRAEYVMGDIFHADPKVITAPNDFIYFSQDVCGLLQPTDQPNNCVPGEDRGYRQFVRENVWRRRMLAAATNDGQLHFFDAGTRVSGTRSLPDGQTREFEALNDGTGKELFAYMPRLTLPIVREQATGDIRNSAGDPTQIYSLDGPLTIRDVFIDPVDEDPYDLDGRADPDQREWRTILMAGLREGGRAFESNATVDGFKSGYYALDITTPDNMMQDPDDEDEFGVARSPAQLPSLPWPSGQHSVLPNCLDFNYGGDHHQADPANCVPVDGADPARTDGYRFPMELWTFTDQVRAPGGALFTPSEEARVTDILFDVDDGLADLAETWSQPVIGQIAVCTDSTGDCTPNTGADVETRHVAIFGGGLDRDNKLGGGGGTWLYMVDVETGQAIYKRELAGAAPSTPAVIDDDNNGIFDAIYIGTTQGILYKVDLTATTAGGDVPAIETVDISPYVLEAGAPVPLEVQRIDDDAWRPQEILTTASSVPIYHPPVVFSIPELELNGLVLGAGDREDLWGGGGLEGRLYVIVEDGGAACGSLPITDACLTAIDWTDPPPLVSGELDDASLLVDSGGNALPGWVMTFPADFRMTSDPFLVTSLLVFSMFEPSNIPLTDVCSRSGDTYTFVIQVQNANPVARLTAVDQGTGGGRTASTGTLTEEDRYLVTDELTTAPFVDETTKNDPNAASDTSYSLADELVADGVREALMSTFPRGSRFNDAFEILVATSKNTTGVVVFAKVPKALYPADWGQE